MARALDTDRLIPRAIILMGVSGSGKSTLGALLAADLACAFLEGDDYHSPENVAKMRDGIALEDRDRWPWLDRLGAAIDGEVASRGLVVAACSALKRSYRARLCQAARVPFAFILLDAVSGELARRVGNRHGHYMPASLLDSQLDTLERPDPDETAIILDATRKPAMLCAQARAWLIGQAA